jgi:hypothetical protein
MQILTELEQNVCNPPAAGPKSSLSAQSDLLVPHPRWNDKATRTKSSSCFIAAWGSGRWKSCGLAELLSSHWLDNMEIKGLIIPHCLFLHGAQYFIG